MSRITEGLDPPKIKSLRAKKGVSNVSGGTFLSFNIVIVKIGKSHTIAFL